MAKRSAWICGLALSVLLSVPSVLLGECDVVCSSDEETNDEPDTNLCQDVEDGEGLANCFTLTFGVPNEEGETEEWTHQCIPIEGECADNSGWPFPVA